MATGLSPGPNHGLVIYSRHTEIYGLQIQNCPGDGIQLFGGLVDAPYLSNITIGAPGKGNVIINNGSYGIEGPIDHNVTVQDNYVGTSLTFIPGQGNLWDGMFFAVQSGVNVKIGGSRLLGQQNYLCSNGYSGLHINIADPAKFQPGFAITGNVIGTDDSGTMNLGNLGFTFGGTQLGGGITLLGQGPISIGGAGGLSNIIAFNYNGVYTTIDDRKTILENSFYCNSNKGIALDFNANKGILPPAILCLQGSNLVGTAPPGMMVDIYLHDATGCANAPCQGKTLLSRVTADVTGMWSYNVAAWPGARFTAIAQDANGNSSEFADCILDPNVNASNGGPYCPGDSIFLFATLDTAAGNVTFEWFGPGGYTSNQQNPVDATMPGTYLVVADIMGCGADSATTDVMVYPLATDTIRDICIGDSVVVNGHVYNLSNLNGEEVLPGAGQYGCDSLVVIDLQYTNGVAARIYATHANACRGDSVDYWFNLELVNGPFDVVYTTGLGPPDTLYGIFDGHMESLVATSDIHFDILDVISPMTSCAPIIFPSDSIMVSMLDISPVVKTMAGMASVVLVKTMA